MIAKRYTEDVIPTKMISRKIHVTSWQMEGISATRGDNNPDGSYSVITNETKTCTQDAWRIGSIPDGDFVDSCR